MSACCGGDEQGSFWEWNDTEYWSSLLCVTVLTETVRPPWFKALMLLNETSQMCNRFWYFNAQWQLFEMKMRRDLEFIKPKRGVQRTQRQMDKNLLIPSLQHGPSLQSPDEIFSWKYRKSCNTLPQMKKLEIMLGCRWKYGMRMFRERKTVRW